MELTVTSIKRKAGFQCAQNLQQAFNELAEAFQARNATRILRRLKICNNFKQNNSMDIAALFNGFGNYFAGLVQTQR